MKHSVDTADIELLTFASFKQLRPRVFRGTNDASFHDREMEFIKARNKDSANVEVHSFVRTSRFPKSLIVELLPNNYPITQKRVFKPMGSSSGRK